MNNTQRQMVIDKLLETGLVSRNWCLERYTSRLGAIICALKKEGWDFRPGRNEGDYVYYVTRKPERYGKVAEPKQAGLGIKLTNNYH